jgi:hypothetical protein
MYRTPAHPLVPSTIKSAHVVLIAYHGLLFSQTEPPYTSQEKRYHHRVLMQSQKGREKFVKNQDAVRQTAVYRRYRRLLGALWSARADHRSEQVQIRAIQDDLSRRAELERTQLLGSRPGAVTTEVCRILLEQDSNRIQGLSVCIDAIKPFETPVGLSKDAAACLVELNQCDEYVVGRAGLSVVASVCERPACSFPTPDASLG